MCGSFLHKFISFQQFKNESNPPFGITDLYSIHFSSILHAQFVMTTYQPAPQSAQDPVAWSDGNEVVCLSAAWWFGLWKKQQWRIIVCVCVKKHVRTWHNKSQSTSGPSQSQGLNAFLQGFRIFNLFFYGLCRHSSFSLRGCLNIPTSYSCTTLTTQ